MLMPGLFAPAPINFAEAYADPLRLIVTSACALNPLEKPSDVVHVPANADPNRDNPYMLDPYARNQQIIHFRGPFPLEIGESLPGPIPVAFKTWGTLRLPQRDNVIVFCHAITGSGDMDEWAPELLDELKKTDMQAFVEGSNGKPVEPFIICCTVFGSPYGTASPVTINPSNGKLYGPCFPQTSVRDDVRLQKWVLEAFQINHVPFVIGGSMGGMQTLEWGQQYPQVVKAIVPMATCGRSSAWSIACFEAQRQTIWLDSAFMNGEYPIDAGPVQGLAAARMQATIIYRTRTSFQTRFGRTRQHGTITTSSPSAMRTSIASARAPAKHKTRAAESYLRYQGTKFVTRFDTNCYIHLTYKVDNHDLSGESSESDECEYRGADNDKAYSAALSRMTLPALVIGIRSDCLFTEQDTLEITKYLPTARLEWIDTDDGHDGFLKEPKQVAAHFRSFVQTLSTNCAQPH